MPVAAATDDAKLTAALTPWLRRATSQPSLEIVDVCRPAEGASNETVLLTVRATGRHGPRAERLVCRIQPNDHQLFLRPDAVAESRVIANVGELSSVPVPSVIATEPSGKVIGVPMFVMSYIDGRVLQDVPSCHQSGWLIGRTAADRTAMWDNGLAAMVKVAQIQAAHRFDFLNQAHGDTALARIIEATRQWFDWMRHGRDFDVLSRAMRYVEDSRPGHDQAVLNWGDARPGNLIFDDANNIAAVIDWEMASTGPAEVDLGWWLMMDEFYSAGLGATPLAGVPDEQAQIRRWEELIGRRAENLDYFKILAALRFAIIQARTYDRFAGKGLLNPHSSIYMHNPVGQMLYRWLGEPVPEVAPEFTALLNAYVAGQG